MNIKTIVLALGLLICGNSYSQDTILAVYTSYDDGVFEFTDSDNSTVYFEAIDEGLAKSFELGSNKTINQGFKIIYVIESDSEDEEYEILRIIGLEKAKVSIVEEIEEEEEEWD